MSLNPVYKVMILNNMNFITSEQIFEICSSLNSDPTITIRNLQSGGYLVRILRKIFYVKSIEEVKMNRTDLSPFDLIKKGLEIKGIEKWYLGLYSALKINGMTHEVQLTEYLLNDTISRQSPMMISGMDFKFIKLKNNMFDFGIVKDPIPHSDPEKTVLDMMYLFRYNGKKDKWIINELTEYFQSVDTNKAIGYLNRYPKTLSSIVMEMVD